MGRCRPVNGLAYRFGEKGIYHGYKITEQTGQVTSANLPKFYVSCENQHRCDYRNAGDYGGNADLALNLPYRIYPD